MKSIILNFILILKLCFFVMLNSSFSNNFDEWKSDIISQAIEAGISKETATQNIKKIKNLNKKILKLYNKQPEFNISFKNYKKRNINNKRIEKGKNLLKKYKILLENISKAYNVSPEIIVSIWALESNFGYYTGSFDIIDALTTLSYQSRRKNFFKRELFNALKILDKELIKTNSLKGSWAGAMGQSQFMPSSYIHYAVDYDQDNKIDIWETEADVFASIANYLYKHGWQKNKPWSIEIKSSFKFKLDSTKKYSLKELKKHNIFNDESNTMSENLYAKIKIINDNDGKSLFLIFENFYIIKKYNNSDFYALTVGKLANKIH